MTHEELKQKDKDLIWHPFTPLLTPLELIPLESAKGMYLHAKDGRKIIDAVSSWWVNIHGHSNEKLAKAIYDQALKMEHAIFAGFTHEPAVKLAENLMTILPDNYTKVFFSDNGSTTVEIGLKMAFQYWFNLGQKERIKVISMRGDYHGDTFGSMAVGECSGMFEPFNPFTFDVDLIEFPDGSNDQEVIKSFQKLAESGQHAAFVFEPLVQGSGGMRMYKRETLNALIKIGQENGVICIADEVMTGWGRTGTHFATDQIEETPDIMCISKGITGGTLPLGITACNSKIEEAFRSDEYSKTLLHGHSYTGNPLSCAAANASFEIYTSDECQNNIKRIEAKHRSFLPQLIDHPKTENPRVTGTILAFDLKGFGDTGYTSEARKRIYPYFLERGILIRPLGNVIYLLPPYIITDDELDYIYKELIGFLDSIDSE